MSHLNGAYYGPSIPPPPPPHRKSYHRPSRGGGCFSCCCGCIFDCILSLICKILTTIVIIAVVLAFFFWLIVHPNVLKFHVTNATLTQFNYTTNTNTNNNTLYYNLSLNVTIRNPNRRLGIYYDRIETLALYKDVRFGSQTLGPFFQHHKNTTVISPVFKGQHVMPLSADQVSELNKEKDSGVYPIDVKLFMTMRFKFVLFKSGNVKPWIRCALHVPMKSRNGTDSTFQETECDWDYKRWWFH